MGERNANDDVNDVAVHDKKSSTSTATTTTTTRIAFGSCHKSLKSSTPPIWSKILPPATPNTQQQQHDDNYLDGWLWLGDAIYPNHRHPITNKKYYGPAPPNEIEIGLHEMKHNNATIGYKDFLHRLVNQNQEKRNQLSQLPIVGGVWDDHDYGGNDMGSNMPNKKERQTIYRDFLSLDHGSNNNQQQSQSQQSSSSSSTSSSSSSSSTSTSTSKQKNDKEQNIQDRDGMYHRIDFENGKIRFLVLDTRWHRDDHCIPSFVRSDVTACFVTMLSIPMLINGVSHAE
jgi:hypothetical protein